MKMITDKKAISLTYVPLGILIPELQELMKEYGEKVYIVEYEEYGEPSYCIEFKRPETPQEKILRLKKETNYQESRRKQYEQLKKEFEDEK